MIFVEAGLQHRFFEVEEELLILVVFAPEEGARASDRRCPARGYNPATAPALFPASCRKVFSSG